MNQPLLDNPVNTYTCEGCGQVHLTIVREYGVTPMMIRCRLTPDCGGRAISAFHQCAQDLAPAFEWRKPTTEEYAALDAATREQHVNRGGLLLYPLAPGPAPAPLS